MRPLNIKISAFGPYAGETNVPMEKLGNKGLYLITGNTGAGKTTIFDAIIFALYGEASGDSRDADMLRSKYAENDTPTFVEMDFEYSGKLYNVKRNPEYLRPKDRGEGYTQQKADATLIYPDGRVVAGAKNVTKTVEELIGINCNQFTQIAMIAQGQFKELLLASTESRGAIFREIFKTKPFQILQLKLKDESAELSKKYDELNKSIIQYVDGVKCSEDNVLFIEFKKIKESKTNTTLEETNKLIETLVTEDEESQNNILVKLSQIEKELEEVNKVLGRAEADEKARLELSNTRQILSQKEPALEELKAVFDKELSKVSEKEKIAIEIEKSIENLSRYNEHEDMISKKAILEKRMKEKKLNQEKFQNSLATIDKKLADAKTEIETLKGAETEKIIAENQLKEVSINKKEICNLSEGLKEYNKLTAKLMKAQADYENASAKSEEQNKKFERMEKAFLDEQAGILASKLIDGEKCPVCGSDHHPEPAKMTKEAPTEEELNRAKAEKETVAKKASELSLAAGVVKGQADGQKKAITEQAKSVLGETEFDSINVDANNKLEKLEATEIIMRRQISDAETKITRKNELEKLIPTCETQKVNIDSEIKNCGEDIVKTDTEIKSLSEQIEKIAEKLEFVSRSEAVEQIEAKKRNKADMERAYNESKKNFEECNQSVNECRTKITTLEKQLDGHEQIDASVFKNKQQQILESKQELFDVKENIGVRLNVNKGALKSIKEQSTNMLEVESRWQWVKALSNTANGNVKGKEKILLETYIQMTYFERIINRANIRLMVMSGGQFELKRRDAADNMRSQSGLELDVIDHYNGTERSVNTLSGGESFKASLALALGLSDEIQSRAGGIQLDTMFIDEGFGSLDEESLQQAMKTLNSLTEGNKLVGIISHVPELKEKIEKQIVVTKEKTGGSSVDITI